MGENQCQAKAGAGGCLTPGPRDPPPLLPALPQLELAVLRFKSMPLKTWRALRMDPSRSRESAGVVTTTNYTLRLLGSGRTQVDDGELNPGWGAEDSFLYLALTVKGRCWEISVPGAGVRWEPGHQEKRRLGILVTKPGQ